VEYLVRKPGSPAPGAGGETAEFLTTFTVTVLAGTPGQVVEDTEAREAQRTRELARQGRLLRLWTLSGQGRALGLWQARVTDGMQAILASLPLDAWMSVQTTPLIPRLRGARWALRCRRRRGPRPAARPGCVRRPRCRPGAAGRGCPSEDS
jgi:muconolactone delta-isomerase